MQAHEFKQKTVLVISLAGTVFTDGDQSNRMNIHRTIEKIASLPGEVGP